MLLGDQLVEGLPNVGSRYGDIPDGARLLEEDEAKLALVDLLVALHGRPGGVGVDARLLRAQPVGDELGVAARESEGGEQAERDGSAVGQALVAAGRLE